MTGCLFRCGSSAFEVLYDHGEKEGVVPPQGSPMRQRVKDCPASEVQNVMDEAGAVLDLAGAA